VNKKGEIMDEIAPYTETEAEKQMSALLLRNLILGTVNMYTPRIEFNDLSLVLRDQYDAMEFNTYQPNNGEAWEGSPQTAWRSRAMRPIVRNKCMSIAAHATARLIFPKIFAYDEESESQEDAAQVMEDLMEWSGDVSNYPYVALMRVITALSSPASIGYTEYGEVTRSVKVERDGDKWIEKRIRDEAYPVFMDCVVPVTQLYIENFYEPDIQKQGWVIWRKVYSYSEAKSKYNRIYDNFQYVRPGVQTIYDDANRTFYYVYDPNMRSEDVEEIVMWHKGLDLKVIKVNNVWMTPCDNPNPRMDKLYPFDKFGYELINARFFYYKDLAFKLQYDADIVNTLYQMVIDGTYLSIFKPMVNVGGEIIASDVIVPGAVTTLSDPNADLRALNVGADINTGLKMLQEVENSISESSQEPQQAGNKDGGSQTAYEISQLEQNANTVLGLFLQMIAKHVKDFGKLRVGDILQYLTMPDVIEVTGEPELVYKTFSVKPPANGVGKGKKIKFDNNMPEDITMDEYLEESRKLMGEEDEKNTEISRVNPGLFRELEYQTTISPDVLNPRSTDLERAYCLEDYDRMVAAPPGMYDPEATAKFLLGNNPMTKKDPDKYLAKQQAASPQPMQGLMPGQASGAMPNAGNSPLGAMAGRNPLNKAGGSNALAPSVGSMV
jgi:hypothetical protein